MTRTAPRLLVALAGVITAVVLLPPWQSSAAPVPRGPKAMVKVAFVHAADRDAAAGFEKLLDGSGFDADLVRSDAAGAADLSAYALVVVGSDTQGGWGDGARAVAAAGRPVLGLGEGGYEFLGRLGLRIGSPHGWHGSDRIVVPVEAGGLRYWTSAPAAARGKEVALYDRTGHVGIHLPRPVDGVEPLGREAGSAAHYPVVRQGRYVLWGFTGPPGAMTAAGRELFLHTCRYAAGLDEKGGDATKR